MVLSFVSLSISLPLSTLKHVISTTRERTKRNFCWRQTEEIARCTMEPMIGQGKSRQEEHRTQRGRRGKDRSLLRKLEGSAEQQEGIEPIVDLCVRRLREELCDDHRPSVATTRLQSARRGPAMAWHAQARARAHRPTRPWHSGPGSGRRRGFLADGPRGRVQPRRRGCDPTTGSGAGHGGAGSYRPRAVQDTASPGAAQAGASGTLGRLPARARPSSASARSALVHDRPQPRPRRGGTASPDVGAAGHRRGGTASRRRLDRSPHGAAASVARPPGAGASAAGAPAQGRALRLLGSDANGGGPAAGATGLSLGHGAGVEAPSAGPDVGPARPGRRGQIWLGAGACF